MSRENGRTYVARFVKNKGHGRMARVREDLERIAGESSGLSDLATPAVFLDLVGELHVFEMLAQTGPVIDIGRPAQRHPPLELDTSLHRSLGRLVQGGTQAGNGRRGWIGLSASVARTLGTRLRRLAVKAALHKNPFATGEKT